MGHPRKEPRAAHGPAAARPPGRERRTVYSLSEQETFDLGHALAQQLRGGELLLLDGELGLGKTVFARGVAVGLGVAAQDVSSPSFTLIQEYRCGRLRVVHIDLYRIDDPAELGTLGLEELLAAGGVTLVEWGAKLPPVYRRGAVTIELHEIGEGSRRIEVSWPEREPPARPGGDA